MAKGVVDLNAFVQNFLEHVGGRIPRFPYEPSLVEMRNLVTGFLHEIFEENELFFRARR